MLVHVANTYIAWINNFALGGDKAYFAELEIADLFSTVLPPLDQRFLSCMCDNWPEAHPCNAFLHDQLYCLVPPFFLMGNLCAFSAWSIIEFRP